VTVTSEQAQACILAYQQIPLTKIEVELATAVELANRFQMYAYDAYLLTCALAQRTPLLTLDRALMAAAKQLNIEVLGEET
jgi:predicted nucleic acid-binding protein